MDEQVTSMKKTIGIFGGISILTGIMVGSGIFFIGSYVLLFTGFSVGLAVVVWLIGGILTLFSGLAYAELGTAYPFSGGYYVYLKEAYGKKVAFMGGFTNFILASSGSIAALAIAFSQILNNFIVSFGGGGLSAIVMKVVAGGVIILLSVINYLGVQIGTNLQKGFLIVKILLIGSILTLGFSLGTQVIDFSFQLPEAGFFSALSVIGFGVVATLWAYEGWTNLNNLTEEMKQPAKTLPKALGWTVFLVMILYVLYNLSIVRIIPMNEIIASLSGPEPFVYLGITAAQSVLGQLGMRLVMLTMLISVFGALSGCIMAFPRVYYAMAKDDTFIPALAKISPKTKTPGLAIFASMLVSMFLLLLELTDLVSLVAFGGLIFNTLIIASVFLFRKRYPKQIRPYSMWGYPVTPILTIILLLLVLVSTFVMNSRASILGLVIILAGYPVYFLISLIKKRWTLKK